MKGMVLVVVGVCIVGLAGILFAIPANQPIAFPAAVTTARQGSPGAAVVKLARARKPYTVARSRGGRAGQINP